MELNVLFNASFPRSRGTSRTAPAVRRGLTVGIAVGGWAILFSSAASAHVGTLGFGWHLVIASSSLVGLMIVAHDAIHSAAHKSFTVNQWVGWLSSACCGVPFTMLANNHLRHHRLVGTEQDPERFCLGPIWQLPLRFPAMLAFYYVDTWSRLTRSAKFQAAAFLVGMVALVTLFPALLALWILPLTIAASLFAFSTVWLPHGPLAGVVMKHLPFITAHHDDHHARPAYPAPQYLELNVWHRSQGTVTRKPLAPVAPVFAVSVARAQALVEVLSAQSGAGRSIDVAPQLQRACVEVAGLTRLGVDLSGHSETLTRKASRWMTAARRARVAVRVGHRTERSHAEVFTELRTDRSNALSWALALLSKQPLVRARVERELAEVLGDRALIESDVARLGYLGQVLSEVLRLHPIAGARIPHQAWVNPGAFDPSRFAADTRHTAAHAELIPMLATLLRGLRVDLRPGFIPRGACLEVRVSRRFSSAA